MSKRLVVQSIIFLVVLISGTWVFLNRQLVKDWLVVQFYDPPAAIAQLATESQLNSRGTHIFYASRPELNNESEFNQNCVFTDKTLVLGCYANERIYVYEVNDDRLDGIEEVTAAHELLHAVYARFSNSKKQEIDSLVLDTFAALEDERLKKVISEYEADDPSVVPNELHSILGTEVRDLPPALEEHYSQYFANRSAIVDLAMSYESVFTEIQDQIEDLAKQITDQKVEIESTEQKLAEQKAAIDAKSDQLEALKSSAQYQEYNAGVPGYNAQVQSYNGLIETYKNLIKDHNELVKQYNELAIEQNDLVQSLDSKYIEVQ